MRAETEDKHSAGKEKHGGSGEGGLHVESAPERPHQEAGNEVADGVDRGERTESHAVLLGRDECGGERILQSLLGAEVKAREDENHS